MVCDGNEVTEIKVFKTTIPFLKVFRKEQITDKTMNERELQKFYNYPFFPEVQKFFQLKLL